MASVGTHLNFDGNAEEVLNFYAGVFDTRIMSIMRYGDFQMKGPRQKVPRRCPTRPKPR